MMNIILDFILFIFLFFFSASNGLTKITISGPNAASVQHARDLVELSEERHSIEPNHVRYFIMDRDDPSLGKADLLILLLLLLLLSFFFILFFTICFYFIRLL